MNITPEAFQIMFMLHPLEKMTPLDIGQLLGKYSQLSTNSKKSFCDMNLEPKHTLMGPPYFTDWLRPVSKVVVSYITQNLGTYASSFMLT